MNDNVSYTTDEIAALLKISKLTVYDLIKKGKLSSYRVGRQMRIDAADLDAYKTREKQGSTTPFSAISAKHGTSEQEHPSSGARSIVLTGQDASLDILAKHIEKTTKAFRPLRSYVGSMDSLIAMYKGEADLVSTHLLDGDTGEYNLPYIRKILIGHPMIVVNLVSRSAGVYVQQGNPKNIRSWADLGRPDIRIVNREKGSGARVLLDEQLRLKHISTDQVTGYENEETSHLGVASRVSDRSADAGVGSEKPAAMVGVEFIPMVKERYDIVMLKLPHNREWIGIVCNILRSAAFHNDLKSIRGYDLTETGRVIFEA